VKRLLIVLLWLGTSLGAWAEQAPDLANDPAVEQRLVAIADELRCLVCQNESLASSHADLAEDLRREVRSLIKSGKSDDDIRAFLVQRYGDFVLYKPPVKPLTWLLWFGPFVLLLGAGFGLYRLARKHQGAAPSPSLDPAQRARAQALLQDAEDSK
jgi:cytochrome c-type biogenesis protein CcmH